MTVTENIKTKKTKVVRGMLLPDIMLYKAESRHQVAGSLVDLLAWLMLTMIERGVSVQKLHSLTGISERTISSWFSKSEKRKSRKSPGLKEFLLCVEALDSTLLPITGGAIPLGEDRYVRPVNVFRDKILAMRLARNALNSGKDMQDFIREKQNEFNQEIALGMRDHPTRIFW